MFSIGNNVSLKLSPLSSWSWYRKNHKNCLIYRIQLFRYRFRIKPQIQEFTVPPELQYVHTSNVIPSKLSGPVAPAKSLSLLCHLLLLVDTTFFHIPWWKLLMNNISCLKSYRNIIERSAGIALFLLYSKKIRTEVHL